jgi:hypothetical protein
MLHSENFIVFSKAECNILRQLCFYSVSDEIKTAWRALSGTKEKALLNGAFP